MKKIDKQMGGVVSPADLFGASQADQSLISTSSDAMRQRREAIVREHIDAETPTMFPGQLRLSTTPAMRVAPLGSPNDGAESMHQLLSGMLAAFPDFHVAVSLVHHADEAVVVEFVMSGTHRGPFAGLAPPGRRIEVPLVGIFEFDEDRLDMATLMRQLQG